MTRFCARGPSAHSGAVGESASPGCCWSGRAGTPGCTRSLTSPRPSSSVESWPMRLPSVFRALATSSIPAGRRSSAGCPRKRAGPAGPALSSSTSSRTWSLRTRACWGPCRPGLDRPDRGLCLAVCGSSVRMMHGALLDAGSPLCGRSTEAFAVRPLKAGYLADAFGPLGSRGACRTLCALGRNAEVLGTCGAVRIAYRRRSGLVGSGPLRGPCTRSRIAFCTKRSRLRRPLGPSSM